MLEQMKKPLLSHPPHIFASKCLSICTIPLRQKDFDSSKESTASKENEPSFSGAWEDKEFFVRPLQ
jgi:hypothetical protein